MEERNVNPSTSLEKRLNQKGLFNTHTCDKPLNKIVKHFILSYKVKYYKIYKC